MSDGSSNTASIDPHKVQNCEGGRWCVLKSAGNSTLMPRLPALPLLFNFPLSLSSLAPIILTDQSDFSDRPFRPTFPTDLYRPTDLLPFPYQLCFHILSFLPFSRCINIRFPKLCAPRSPFTIMHFEALWESAEIQGWSPHCSYSLLACVLRRTRCRQGRSDIHI